MSVRMKLGAALIVVAVAIGFLIYKEATQSSTFYMSVNQAEQSRTNNQTITVNGNIVGKTIAWDEKSQLLRFSIWDKPGEKMLPVVFHGTKPDEFSSGWPVIVTGHLAPAGTFYANQLLIKCPSKYSSESSVTYRAKA